MKLYVLSLVYGLLWTLPLSMVTTSSVIQNVTQMSGSNTAENRSPEEGGTGKASQRSDTEDGNAWFPKLADFHMCSVQIGKEVSKGYTWHQEVAVWPCGP